MKTRTFIIHCISILITVAVLSHVACHAQEPAMVQGKIEGLGEAKLVLNRLLGHREFKIAETQSAKDGSFSIPIGDAPIPGQFRLRIEPNSQNRILDFLLYGESIRFETHISGLVDSMKFLTSDLNKAWYDYFRLKEDYETRLNILEQLLGFYPNENRFYSQIISEFGLLQDELDQKAGQLVQRYPNTMLERYVKSDLTPKLNPNATPEQRQEFMKYNFLNNVDFSDTLLLRTDILPNKALAYIMLYRNPRADRQTQEQEFIKATDNLLPLAMHQPSVFNYLLEYTISGFEQIGMENVLTYIADNYAFDESCVSNHDSGELQRRMEGYRMLAPGNKAPDLKVTDIAGNSFQLSDVKADKILIVFWASWCPHCTTILPQIKSLASHFNSPDAGKDAPSFKVISVSIDHDKEPYFEYLNKHGLNDPALSSYWINICDFEAWEGPLAQAYYLFATPTMLLLDKDFTILDKPASVRDIGRALQF